MGSLAIFRFFTSVETFFEEAKAFENALVMAMVLVITGRVSTLSSQILLSPGRRTPPERQRGTWKQAEEERNKRHLDERLDMPRVIM